MACQWYVVKTQDRQIVIETTTGQRIGHLMPEPLSDRVVGVQGERTYKAYASNGRLEYQGVTAFRGEELLTQAYQDARGDTW